MPTAHTLPALSTALRTPHSLCQPWTVCAAGNSLLFAVYPAVLLYLFIAGLAANYGHPAAVAILVVGTVLPALLSLCVYRRRMRKGQHNRQDVVVRLRATPITSHDFHPLLEEAFDRFDIDNSGVRGPATERATPHACARVGRGRGEGGVAMGSQ